jgi:hypothetical protein
VTPRVDRGTTFIELTVALLCTSLLAAGVLSLVGDAAWLCRQRRAGIEAEQLAIVAVDVLAREVEGAGVGLEGATAVDWRGGHVPLIEARAGGMAVVTAVGLPVEVEPLAAAATGQNVASVLLAARRIAYRAEAVRAPGARRATVALSVNSRVAGLGAEGWVVPAGTVRESRAVGSRGTVVVDWDRTPASPVRALVPIRRRELELRFQSGALQLRRRDNDGNWQPMVDGIEELTIRYGRDGDGDGFVDSWDPVLHTVSPAPGPGWSAVEVTARMVAIAGAAGQAPVARRTVRQRGGL